MTEKSEERFQELLRELGLTDSVGTLKKLNDCFIMMYSEVADHEAELTEDQAAYIKGVLFTQYQSKCEVLLHRAEIEQIRENAVHSARKAYFTPDAEKRHWYSLHRSPNPAMQTIEEEVALEAQRYFAERSRWLDKVAAAFEEEFFPKDDGELVKGMSMDEEMPADPVDVERSEHEKLPEGGQKKIEDGQNKGNNEDNGGEELGEGGPEGDREL